MAIFWKVFFFIVGLAIGIAIWIFISRISNKSKLKNKAINSFNLKDILSSSRYNDVDKQIKETRVHLEEIKKRLRKLEKER